MKRNINLDLIRAIAIILVMVNHTFKLGVMSLPQAGIRCIALAGVPLFLMLTGYLNNKKTCEDYYVKGKWHGCIRILTAYLILGTICYIGGNLFDCKNISIKDFIFKLLSFRLTPYGWYIEMWIGLFFFTPFLNMIIQELSDKSEKILLITLIFFTCIASFFNRNGINILPNFWISTYPITLYFIGYYISKHEINIPKWLFISYIIIVAIGEPLLNFIVSSKQYLYFWGGQDDIVYAVLAFLIFTKIKNLNLNNIKLYGITKVSFASLHMYLISYLFDHIWYKTFENNYFTDSPINNLPYYFIIFILSFCCTLPTSLLYIKIEKKIFKI